MKLGDVFAGSQEAICGPVDYYILSLVLLESGHSRADVAACLCSLSKAVFAPNRLESDYDRMRVRI